MKFTVLVALLSFVFVIHAATFPITEEYNENVRSKRSPLLLTAIGAGVVGAGIVGASLLGAGLIGAGLGAKAGLAAGVVAGSSFGPYYSGGYYIHRGGQRVAGRYNFGASLHVN